jgi:3-methyladenine DNA glycosylase AlkD
MENIIGQIRNELEQQADEKTRESGRRFFKEEVKTYGVKSNLVGKIAKEYYNKAGPIEKAELFKLCEELWKSGYMEESFIACNWSYFARKSYVPDDFKEFESWLDRYVSNWASCDTFCNHTIGAFIERYPDYLSRLKKWTKSDNRWVRRGAAVSLIVPARKGKYLNEIIEIADASLTDGDDMVQKGYGWMLKVASQSYQKEIFDYVMSRKHEMPRTALRYAIEKMPDEMRKEAMKRV